MTEGQLKCEHRGIVCALQLKSESNSTQPRRLFGRNVIAMKPFSLSLDGGSRTVICTGPDARHIGAQVGQVPVGEVPEG